MKSTPRPDFIRHWQELEGPDNEHYTGSDELMAIGSPLARSLGLTRLGIHHIRLLPGRRMSYPHAESSEEEFVFVVEGTPDAWINGELHPLKAGDAVGFPSGTGLCHTFINNSSEEARFIVVGEANKAENRIHYPLNPVYEATREDRWVNPPEQQFGDHNGLPDKLNNGDD
ncbi:cupin domain-containing protein [Erwinia pyri]|uniref:Cupin domain-containing protein n=1 Tax=Erwinia pyri TaxID=3062598 RepID=A0AA50DL31_9GAMM|nr:cupin domain-containing protein [Erwinia sp. DE2]WLS79737.1 cupin domain-containing protein [Erwinia sp. DE2]